MHCVRVEELDYIFHFFPQVGSALEIGIIQQFPFESGRQCMSVIVRGLDDPNFTIFVKGSPEKISSLSKVETIPENFQKTLAK